MRKISSAPIALVFAVVGAYGQTEAPKYILSSGISFSAVQQSTSSVTTLAVKVTDIAGLPTFQATTLETALVRTDAGLRLASSGTIRIGACQTAYRNGNVLLGGCTDIGAMKSDTATLGTISGSPFILWDIGAALTKGKSHVYLVPAVRWIAISGMQIQPSWSLRIGTGF